MVASKFSICHAENITGEFQLCSMFKHSPTKKAWFMAPVKTSTNGKGIMTLIEYTPLVYRPNEKAMVL